MRTDKGPAPYDIQRSFRANFLYALPLLKWTGWNSRSALLLADGWQISGIITTNTGLPINAENNSANSVDPPDIASCVNPIFSNFSGTLLYVNAAAFLQVAIPTTSGEQVRPGNLGLDALRAPGMWNLDLSAAKNIAVTERLNPSCASTLLTL